MVGTYVRRRSSGVTPWRPLNSRILDFHATIPQIEQPPGPSYTDGQLLPPDSLEWDVVRPRTRGR